MILIMTRTSVFTLQPLRSELEIIFCSKGLENHEKELNFLITIFFLFKIKIDLKCQDWGGFPPTRDSGTLLHQKSRDS